MASRRFLMSVILSSHVLLAVPGGAAPPATPPVAGLREHNPAVHALVSARLVLGPGRVVERGVLIIRDGVITQAGEGVAVPEDARVWDLSGKSIYPGLIDGYSEMSLSLPAGGAPYWNPLVTPQASLAAHFQPDAAIHDKLRKQGFTARLVAPSSGVVKGTSVLVTTGNAAGDRGILKSDVALHLRLGISRERSRAGYPNSPMGAVALARQAFYDAQWYGRAWGAFQANPVLPRPERNDALAALSRSAGGQQLVVIDAPNELYLLRADAFAREFSLQAAIRGSGREYRRLDAVGRTGRTVILPVNFPRPPQVGSPEAAADVELDELLHWDLAPENPARLAAAGVTFAFTSSGLRDVADYLSGIRTAVARGLPADAALAALTLTPAQLYGVADRLGTLDAGKGAHLVVTDGELFDRKTRILETWVDGQRFETEPSPVLDLRGEWRVTVSAEPGKPVSFLMKLTGTPRQLQGTIPHSLPDGKAEEIKLRQLVLSDARVSGTFEAKAWDHPGIAQFSAAVIRAPSSPPSLVGTLLWPDGKQAELSAAREKEANATSSPAPGTPGTDPPAAGPAAGPSALAPTRSSEKPSPPGGEPGRPVSLPAGQEGVAAGDRPSSVAMRFPLNAFGRAAPPEQPRLLWIKNATIWTCGPQGVLTNASLLVEGGRIRAVGTDIPPPADALVIDATGKHLSPGIIDCHSHMATDGGVNESSQAITAEVRIADFLDANDVNIYRQLAGGVTSANILHGSANPIGGQNQVIKLRWGGLPEQLKFAEAPPGIKFALGENVKQSNRNEPGSRYPQSRMGVEQIVRDAFHAARQYQQAWQRWEQQHDIVPPRRDLELEALLEILEGKRWIHCHSYRQDEILALLRTCEEFQIRIATLQHILEGYKVADAMARHGAMGSAFSDWWAYKIEVYDAIPYAGALMHQAGVVVSFNSDDQELARHLNHEAAKAVKYGGVAPEEALKFVTLNPARQLRIDAHVGSLEPGKHADFVVWSGPPLSILSRCEQTWIDGRRYFDMAEDRQRQEENRVVRSTLIQKILASGQTPRSSAERQRPDEELWPRFDVFCRARD